jgi:hypothetical protein
MEKVSWTDRVKSEEVFHTVNEENTLHTIKIKKAKWSGHILLRNCILKHVTEAKIGGTGVAGKRGRRHKRLLDDLMEKRKILETENSHWKKLWTCCKRDCGMKDELMSYS